MLNLKALNKSGEFFALWASPPKSGAMAVVATIGSGGITLVEVLPVATAESDMVRRLSRCARGVLLLSPEHYSYGLVVDPVGVGVADGALKEALRWAFAKDAEMDMSTAEFEVLPVKGAESGGGLLRDSHWIFAIAQGTLKDLLRPLLSKGVQVTAVDGLTLAQRNLCWAEAMNGRDGGHASLVVGSDYSALGIVSKDGDQLFHKQLEWTQSSILAPESRDRFIVDLQRNLGYFERRQSAFGLVQGYVYGIGSGDVASLLKEGLGSFDWKAGLMPRVEMKAEFGPADGSLHWLVGAMKRWA